MSERVEDLGLAVWIALRRAHQSGVTNLAGQWRDSGSPVPGDVADVLDRLISSGQLALADPDPESCGALRVTVTDTGYARYVTLCQVYNFPDSGWPVAEAAPGARPDITAPACLRVIDSPAAAGQALAEYFLANADRGDNAANDHLVTELIRRIRAQQDTRDGGRSQQPPSQPVDSASPAADVVRGDRLPGGSEHSSSSAPPPVPGGQPDPHPRAAGSSGGLPAAADGSPTTGRPIGDQPAQR